MARDETRVYRNHRRIGARTGRRHAFVGPTAYAPIIDVADAVVLVRKPYLEPERRPVTLHAFAAGTSEPFRGTGVFARSRPSIRFFDAPEDGTEIRFDGRDNVFSGRQLSEGVTLYAEGATPSAELSDVTLTLELSASSVGAGGAPQDVGPPEEIALTAVELFLDIYQSRRSAGVDPRPLPPEAKVRTGRYLHVQDRGNHHGRGMLVVRGARPAAFAGTIVLEAQDARVEVYEQEVAANGQSALPLPIRLPNGDIPDEGRRYWVQGADVSNAQRDTGLTVGVEGVSGTGDRVAVTVVRLRRLAAAPIWATPPNRRRLNNWPRNHRSHALRRGTTRDPDPTNYDLDATTNPPLVLLEDSALPDTPISMSVRVEPSGTPVSWEIVRDRRPAPDGDHADIVALSPNPVPTLTPDRSDPLKATLLSDAVGSFHIRPYVDCNGSGQFDHTDPATGNRIDREPHIIMNLVLVRVQGHRNRSRARPGNISITPAAPTAATGLGVRTGTFANGPGAGAHNDAWVTVIGGGNDGRRGLDRVFAGWINNGLAVGSSITRPRGEDAVAEYQQTTAPGATMTRRRVSILTSTGAGSTFLPGGGAPTPVRMPVLDTTNFGNEGTGGNRAVGCEGAVGPPTPIQKRNVAIGQRWRVQMWDSPGDSCPPQHDADPGPGTTWPLTGYRFNLSFRSDLCFWTNSSRAAGATRHAACRLYVSVLTNHWDIRISHRFNPATGAGTPGRRTLRMRRDPTPTRRGVPVKGSGLEVRAPIYLNLLATDART
jgi:hypothetical protein